MFRSFECPTGPNEDDPMRNNFSWSSQSPCKDWTPTAVADEALQVLTMRKLEGKDIKYPYKQYDDDDDDDCGPM